jgi:hypothetical protein
MLRNITTVQIHFETRELLKKIGHKRESYDSLAQRLMHERVVDNSN